MAAMLTSCSAPGHTVDEAAGDPGVGSDGIFDSSVNPGNTPEVPDEAAGDPVGGFDGIFDASVNPGNTQEVVYVTGSWSEMGRQYGLQQKTQLENNWSTLMVTMLSIEEREEVYNSMGEILAYLQETDSAVYDFIMGVADGAEICGEDAAIATLGSAILNADTLLEFQGKRDNTCMTVSAWGEMTADGHVLGAANLDAVSSTPAAMFSDIVSYPDEGYAVIASGGMLGNAFMNSAGLVITYAGGPHVAPEEGDEVLDRAGTFFDSLFGYWYTATVCGTADEAVAMLTEGDWIHSGNINIADSEGNAYVVEQRDYATVVRKAGEHEETDYLITANQFLDESWMNDNYEAYPDCGPRYWTVEKIMQDEAGSVTPATIAKGLGSIRYYEDGQWSEENWGFGGFYQFHSPEGDDTAFKTILRTVFDATDGEAYILRGHDEKFRSDIPFGTTNYVRLVLAGDMASTNQIAENDARVALRNAGEALYHRDNVSSTEIEMYDLAAEAIHTGANYTNMAAYAEISGDTESAVVLYGLATSQYAIAQRYAQASYTTENPILDF